MLSSRQIIVLLITGVLLWGLTALYVRLVPQAFLDPLWGTVMFLVTPVSIWLNIQLVRRLAGLASAQILPGVCLVGAVALMLQGLGLRWLPLIYKADSALIRMESAWVFWGYGLSLLFALLMSRTRQA